MVLVAKLLPQFVGLWIKIHIETTPKGRNNFTATSPKNFLLISFLSLTFSEVNRHSFSNCSTLSLYNNSVSKNIISKILSKLEKLQRLQKLASNHFLRSILGLWSFKRWYFKLLSYLKYSKKYFFPQYFLGFYQQVLTISEYWRLRRSWTKSCIMIHMSNFTFNFFCSTSFAVKNVFER